MYLTIAVILTTIFLAVVSYFVGRRLSNNENYIRIKSLEQQIEELQEKTSNDKIIIEQQGNEIRLLSTETQVQETKLDHYRQRLNEVQEQAAQQLQAYEEKHNAAVEIIKEAYEHRIEEQKNSYVQQLRSIEEAHEKQLDTLREMNRKQVETQTKLIKEQFTTTSETILKARQMELGEQNKEQVGKIIDPLQRSLKEMQAALDKTKEQQSEALTRLDATIKINMQQSAQLGETADRLTRALTGEVKIQGNFGELKLKQLLEDLELREGEQFDTQQTLRDKAGRSIKNDEGANMIPDFILHFPNNRHVVVDAKMSLTDYERYMNCENPEEKTSYLKAHINSVRNQVKRLARKEYTRFLPTGYNRLSFVIMYIPIEGALNLALLNDTTLWREAYDHDVMILGPQTMYMNLRVLEMMWTQVRQLNNQQAMIDAANIIIDRIQDFGIRFMEVESSMHDTISKIGKLKITTADNGASIITAARNLLKAGAKENKKKKRIDDISEAVFIDSDPTTLLASTDANTEDRCADA